MVISRSLLSKIVIGIVIVTLFVLILVLLCQKSSTVKYVEKLASYRTEIEKCPPLEKGGIVNVYVSAAMFNLADVLYAVGPGGISGDMGANYSSIAAQGELLCFSKEDEDELKQLCDLVGVPWYGTAGEIKKLGWYSYTPLRDGLQLDVLLSTINSTGISVEDYESEYTGAFDNAPDLKTKWEGESIFNPANVELQNSFFGPRIVGGLNGNFKDLPAATRLNMYATAGVQCLATMVGAQDLYNMYGACNVCLFNFNGLQADSGALAEMGQLGARGVPMVILKGSPTYDFGNDNNPMPIMASTSDVFTAPVVRKTPGIINSVGTDEGALDHLYNRVQNIINSDNLMASGSFNSIVPLPPLQIFWTDVGSRGFFLKHRTKNIPTDENGMLDMKTDYTDFWIKYYTGSPTNKDRLQIVKALSDSLYLCQRLPKYKDLDKFWK